MALSINELDFGTVPNGTVREATFWLENPGNNVIEIDNIKTSCDCFQVTLRNHVIEPASRVLATATVDFSDDFDFTGSLCLEAKGAAKGAGQLAFLFSVKVNVEGNTRDLK